MRGCVCRYNTVVLFVGPLTIANGKLVPCLNRNTIQHNANLFLVPPARERGAQGTVIFKQQLHFVPLTRSSVIMSTRLNEIFFSHEGTILIYINVTKVRL